MKHKIVKKNEAKYQALVQQIFPVVQQVIGKHDPESLFKLGCPSNEYDSTSKDIADAILREGVRHLSITALANLISFVMHMHYEMWSTPVVLHHLYFEIASELKPLLPDVSLKG